MTPLPIPSKPLRILTIDGAGLQAISILLILDKVLSTIAKTNGLHRKPRPCDVFDVIAGIGSGGWLALLLGRFHMDITACLSEWYEITQSITLKSKGDEMRVRISKNRYFDHLMEHISDLTKVYGTGDYLFGDGTDSVRTRHVFVAALRSDAKGYHLFRTYAVPASAKLLEGPEYPARFKISRAFAVTGAAKYFSPAWTEKIARSGNVQFCDSESPKPHNITQLALNEMWALYGTEVPLSVIVNIGPGLPCNFDIKKIEQKSSWSLSLSPKISSPQKISWSPAVYDKPISKKREALERVNNITTSRGKSSTARLIMTEHK
jgi:hypothetical protein